MARAALVSVVLAAALGIGARSAAAEDRKPVVRVGIFDSRAVALAYGRSEEFERSIKAMRDDFEKAKAVKDEKRVKELENEGGWSQVRLHQQAFSTATVSSILAKVKDKLPAIAHDARVVMIVSKWEVQFKDPAIETVDLTLPMVKLFHPSEQVLKWIEQMKDQEPVPFEKLPLDPMM
jgi:hypothetical protein